MKPKKQQSRVVWITGASSGIGEALANVFAEEGDIAIATSRRLSAVKKIQQKLTRAKKQCEALRCDVGREEDIRRTAALLLKRHKRIDVVINNAGVTSFNDVLHTSLREFDEILATNLRSLFLTTKAVLPSMLKKKRGVIINILSYAAKTTYTNSVAYSAAKSGAEALMNVLRAEVREKGVKVINVYPGAVVTPMWSKKQRKRYARVMMTPVDIARLVHHLSLQPDSVHVEEVVVRPPIGDLKV